MDPFVELQAYTCQVLVCRRVRALWERAINPLMHKIAKMGFGAILA